MPHKGYLNVVPHKRRMSGSVESAIRGKPMLVVQASPHRVLSPVNRGGFVTNCSHVPQPLAQLIFSRGAANMHIYGPSMAGGIQSIHGPHAARSPHGNLAPSSSPRGADELDLSASASLISQVNELPDIRSELVDRVKAQIAAGTYETADRFDVAVERMLDELA